MEQEKMEEDIAYVFTEPVDDDSILFYFIYFLFESSKFGCCSFPWNAFDFRVSGSLQEEEFAVHGKTISVLPSGTFCSGFAISGHDHLTAPAGCGEQSDSGSAFTVSEGVPSRSPRSFQKCLKSGQQTAATLCKMTASPYTVEDSGTLRIHSSAEPGVRSTGFVCQKQSDLWLSPKKKSIRKGEKVKFTFAKKMGLGTRFGHSVPIKKSENSKHCSGMTNESWLCLRNPTLLSTPADQSKEQSGMRVIRDTQSISTRVALADTGEENGCVEGVEGSMFAKVLGMASPPHIPCSHQFSVAAMDVGTAYANQYRLSPFPLGSTHIQLRPFPGCHPAPGLQLLKY
ncbi:hypothetical protein ACRRTK_004687 [Alexandromys fortis]